MIVNSPLNDHSSLYLGFNMGYHSLMATKRDVEAFRLYYTVT